VATIDPLTLRNRILYRLNAAGFKTDTQTVDYWYAIAKALVLGGLDSYEVLVSSTDTTPDYLLDKLLAGNDITLSTITNSNGEQFIQIAVTSLPTDDHKVLVDNIDTIPDFLANKLYAGSNITLSVVTVGGERKVQIGASGGVDSYEVKVESTSTPGYLSQVVESTDSSVTIAVDPSNPSMLNLKVPKAYPGPMAPVGTQFAGNTGLWADGNHSHPGQSVTVTGATLYPGQILDTDLHNPARAILYGIPPQITIDSLTAGFVQVVLHPQAGQAGSPTDYTFTINNTDLIAAADGAGQGGQSTMNVDFSYPTSYPPSPLNPGQAPYFPEGVIYSSATVTVEQAFTSSLGTLCFPECGLTISLDAPQPSPTPNNTLSLAVNLAVGNTPQQFTNFTTCTSAGSSTWLAGNYEYIPQLLVSLSLQVVATPLAYNFAVDWTQIAGQSMWQYNTNGQLYGLDANQAATVIFNPGDRAMLPSSSISGDRPYLGVYNIVNPGSATTKAVIQRASDANQGSQIPNMVVPINGGSSVYENGAEYQCTTSVVTIDSTPLTFVLLGSPYSPTNQYNLFTAAEVATLNVDNSTQLGDVVITASSGLTSLATSAWGQAGIWTLSGVPGASTIPAGPWTANTYASAIGGDAGATTQIEWQIRIRHSDGSTNSPFLFVWTPPLTPTPTAYAGLVTLATPVTILPTDTIDAIPYAHTSSTTNVEVNLIWQDPTRATNIVTTLTLATTGGTNDHQQLVNRFYDVGQGQTAEHNWDGIGPGFAHTPFGTDTATGGWLNSPVRNNMLVTIDSSNIFQGIGTANKFGGDVVECTFLQPVTIVGLASVVGQPGFAPLLLTYSGAYAQNLDWYSNTVAHNRAANGRAAFRLRTDSGVTPSPCWELLYFIKGIPVS
jgi:hypothetical protein